MNAKLLLRILFEVGVDELVHQVPYEWPNFGKILCVYVAAGIISPGWGGSPDAEIPGKTDVLEEFNFHAEGINWHRIDFGKGEVNPQTRRRG